MSKVRLQPIRHRHIFKCPKNQDRVLVASCLILKYLAKSSPYFQSKPHLLSPYSAHFAFGITISRKVGNAVMRNRCRRRIRALLHNASLPDPLVKDFFCIFICRYNTAKVPYSQLKKDLYYLLKKASKTIASSPS